MNRQEFKKGTRNLLMCLPLLFLGPTIIHSAFKNQGHPFYIPVLAVGIGICIFAVGLGFKGLQKIVNSL